MSSLRRIGAILIKEFLQMRRDRITLAMIIGIPLMQLCLFGFDQLQSQVAAHRRQHADPGLYARSIVAAMRN
jgi:ABC-2 type transport system permease protein